MKTELKNLQHSSHAISLSKLAIFAKMLIFAKKNADISNIKLVLVLAGIFSKIKYLCVLTYQISSF